MANPQPQPYYAIRTRRPAGGSSTSSVDSTYGSGIDYAPPATHDTSRVSYHVQQLDTFAETLQESASRAFPNRGRSSQRYKSVQVLLLHWKTDDLFVLPELEDLEASFREEYGFNTDVFAIPADNPHLDLMMRIGSLVKDHESDDTLFIVYYGGHAKIDESRQSTWCATRHSGSPSLQWSAIQTLLERSASDVLVLLDCCAGAASATFPNGKSTTETISASSWDAIAPDPGRYSFTNALIEVLDEWRHKTFSAAMLHAEILARLKHPRPILVNGKRFEARATPVHFMMTSDHRAPSIEMSRIIPPDRLPPSPAREPSPGPSQPAPGRGPGVVEGECFTEPNEDKPHVMISLALEGDQRLDLGAWEQWLASFPALAKYVKVQGVFKSHSTLLLLSLPITIWNLLPEDQACSFVAFIRSNNLIKKPKEVERPIHSQAEVVQSDSFSVFSGTTFRDSMLAPSFSSQPRPQTNLLQSQSRTALDQDRFAAPPSLTPISSASSLSASSQRPLLRHSRSVSSYRPGPLSGVMSLSGATCEDSIVRQPLINRSRSAKRTVFNNDRDLPDAIPLAAHVVSRLEDYYQKDPNPSDGTTEYYASHLGIEAADVKIWFHRQRRKEQAGLGTPRKVESVPKAQEAPQLIVAAQLNGLLEIFPPAQILFVDLRSPSEYQRSHIHNAVNLRVPSKYLSKTSPAVIDRTFPDEQSRRYFTRWSKARCMVIYDRNIEAPWECPTAPALLDMLKREGWPGRCFVLRGAFREFSLSYDKYVTGDRMSKESKKYTDGLRAATPPSEDRLRRDEVRYDDWLRRVQQEGSGGSSLQPTNYSKPRDVTTKKAAVDDNQRELEAEFRGRCPDLYRKMKDMTARDRQQYSPAPRTKHGKEVLYDDDPYFDTRKAHLVGSLSTGLDKLRDTAPTSTPGPSVYSFPNERLPDKLGELPSLDYDDFDEIDPREAQSPYLSGTAAATTTGRSAASPAASGTSAVGGPAGPPPAATPLDHVARRGVSSKQGLWKRLRSNTGK